MGQAPYTAFPHPGAEAIINDIARATVDAGMIVTKKEQCIEGERHFAILLRKQKSTNPDAYVILAFMPEIDLIGKEARQLGISDKLVSIEALEWSEDKALFESSIFFAPNFGNSDFADNYRSYGGYEPKHGASYAYDAMHLLAYGFENALEKASVTDVLKNKSFNFSKEIHVGNDKVIRSYPQRKTIQESKVVVIEKE